MPKKRKRESTLTRNKLKEEQLLDSDDVKSTGKSKLKEEQLLDSDDVKSTRKSKLKEEQLVDGNDVKSTRRILKPKLKQASNTVEYTHWLMKSEPEASNTVEYTHWLMKSEPESRFENGVDVKFGIEDLKACPKQIACWDGVRNYQARNFMRDQMRVGHKVFFYHSNTKEPGIAGVCEVVKESYVDHTQFDSKDPHHDRASKKDNPKWFMVDVQFKRMMKRYIPLSELKALHLKHKESGGPLKNIALFTKARLSVQPLTQEEWDFIISLEDTE